MDTILVFSLLFIYYSFSPKESEKALTKEELSRNHIVATLQCSDLLGSIQVNLLYSQKMFVKTLYKPNIKYTLQSLKIITDPKESVSTGHSCLLTTEVYKQRFLTEFNLTGKVFLVGISNCIIKAKLLEPDISAKQLYATAVSQQNSSSGIQEDKMLRQRQSIYFKAAITCILLPCALAFIVFVIFEFPIPHPCLRWSRQCNCIQKCKRQEGESTDIPNSVSS